MIRVTVEHIPDDYNGHLRAEKLGEIDIVREEQVTAYTHEYSVLLVSKEHGEIDTEVQHIRSDGWLELVIRSLLRIVDRIEDLNMRAGEARDELKNT